MIRTIVQCIQLIPRSNIHIPMLSPSFAHTYAHIHTYTHTYICPSMTFIVYRDDLFTHPSAIHNLRIISSNIYASRHFSSYLAFSHLFSLSALDQKVSRNIECQMSLFSSNILLYSGQPLCHIHHLPFSYPSH